MLNYCKIRGNPRFSIDIFHIKAYYWLVRMGKQRSIGRRRAKGKS